MMLVCSNEIAAGNMNDSDFYGAELFCVWQNDWTTFTDGVPCYIIWPSLDMISVETSWVLSSVANEKIKAVLLIPNKYPGSVVVGSPWLSGDNCQIQTKA